MIAALVRQYLDGVDAGQLLAIIDQLNRHDRYQASAGIEAAASIVAREARAAGLRDVTVDDYPADGRRQWWRFEAPVSWTPRRAVLEARLDGRCRVRVDHATQPFSLATHSAATAPGGQEVRFVRVAATDDIATAGGAMALLDRAVEGDPGLVGRLEEAGALGFVSAGPAVRDGGVHAPGRIELRAHTTLTAFSVTPAVLDALGHWADRGALAHVDVALDRTARMPVVQAVWPGQEPGEILLTAHLCHPRPGANDNASGVAALLGAGRLLAARGRALRRTVRFAWGPEYVGTAALLHARERLAIAAPVAVINLDMVGEDQTLCGSPFVLERCPDHHASPVNPLAQAVIAQVFALTGPDPGRWRTAPFLGYSDHALFADPRIASPAVQLCHYPDRFNHSAADDLSKVSPLEMRRSTAAAASLAHLLADWSPQTAAGCREALDAWARDERVAVQRLARQAPAADGSWAGRLAAHVETGIDAVRAAADRGMLRGCVAAAPGAGPVLTGTWEGPLNLRAAIADMPAGVQADVLAGIRRDKLDLAILFNLAIHADGAARQAVLDRTAFGLRRPIDPGRSGFLLDALLQSGWLRERPG